VRRKVVRLLVALLAVVMLALVPAAASATSRAARIQIVNHVPLQPDGTVTMSVKYVCKPLPEEGTLRTRVSQPQATGQVELGALCDGKKQR
jgi:hypothetical protein